jgi:hypothetical protein
MCTWYSTTISMFIYLQSVAVQNSGVYPDSRVSPVTWGVTVWMTVTTAVTKKTAVSTQSNYWRASRYRHGPVVTAGRAGIAMDQLLLPGDQNFIPKESCYWQVTRCRHGPDIAKDQLLLPSDKISSFIVHSVCAVRKVRLPLSTICSQGSFANCVRAMNEGEENLSLHDDIWSPFTNAFMSFKSTYINIDRD